MCFKEETSVELRLRHAGKWVRNSKGTTSTTGLTFRKQVAPDGQQRSVTVRVAVKKRFMSLGCGYTLGGGRRG